MLFNGVIKIMAQMQSPEMRFLSESLIRDVIGREPEPVDSDDNMVRWDSAWDSGAHYDGIVRVLTR